MSTMIDPPVPANSAAQLWMSTLGGWRVRADQLVALQAGENFGRNLGEPRYAVTARAAYDPDTTYTLAQFEDEALARQCLAKLLERMAGWNKGFGTVMINDRTGGVIISRPTSRESNEAEREASAS